MRRVLASVVLSVTALYSLSVCSSEKSEISVEDVRAIETRMVLPAISFFMTIHNTGTGKDVLLSAHLREFPSAKVELHDVVDGKMTRIDKVEIPRGGTIQLKPGGLHLMAFKVRNPKREFALVLKFKESGELEVKVPLSAPHS